MDGRRSPREAGEVWGQSGAHVHRHGHSRCTSTCLLATKSSSVPRSEPTAMSTTRPTWGIVGSLLHAAVDLTVLVWPLTASAPVNTASTRTTARP
jgi:hypothetical protein